MSIYSESLQRMLEEFRAARKSANEESTLSSLISHTSQDISLDQIKLMERLRTGQEWLTEVNARLQAEDAVDTPLNERLANGFDLWGKLENLLRLTYKYEGCIHGIDGHCPEATVCVCTACVGNS